LKEENETVTNCNAFKNSMPMNAKQIAQGEAELLVEGDED